jgi:nucleotide-binding universal stress UspA family protein
MTKSILCAIDFSESSLHALQWAAELSSQFKCHLTVLYPYRLLQTSKGDVVGLKQKNLDMATQKFEVLKKEFLHGKVNSYNFSAEVGFLSDRIEDHIEKNSIMMMILGKNMNSASQDNLQDLINNISVPVLIVP